MKFRDTNYEVNELGDVFNSKTGKKLKPQDNGKGYLQVHLRINKKHKWLYVHRMVAECFILNPENKPTVNHKNGVKKDNWIENLEWHTYSENHKHAINLGLIDRKGIKNGRSKLNEDDIIFIRTICFHIPNPELAKSLNVDISTICNVKLKKTWAYFHI